MVTGTLTAFLVIVGAFAITDVVVGVFTRGESLADVTPAIIVLAVVVVARVATAYLSETLAFRAAASAKSQLRIGVVRHVMALGPVWLSRGNSGEIAQLVTRGIDGLDAYFSRYLPQLVLAVTVPISVGVVIAFADPLAAVIVALTVPLIPMFMVLVGLYTKRKVNRQWRVLGVLSGHFGDVVAGMTTLKAYGRASAQAERVRAVGAEYRVATMGVLRISFLSALVLELLAMLSIALVAVSIGVRLVNGSMTLHSGLLILILIPEVYLPLRQVGAHFHAAAEGLGAAGQMIDIMVVALPKSGSEENVPDLAKSDIALRGVSVRYEGRSEPALRDVSIDLPAGRITALVGPSGCGKSTVLGILERFVDPCAGDISVLDHGTRTAIEDFDIVAWRSQIAWVGQDPQLIPASIADNVRLGTPSASAQTVDAALASVGLADVVAGLAAGAQTLVGEGATSLSVGQTRRIALARAFCSDARLVLLDEPTAALDAETEAAVLRAIRALAADRTIVMVAHRSAMIDMADNVISLSADLLLTDPATAHTDATTSPLVRAMP